MTAGYIYVMCRGDARKIGWSGDPDARRSSVQTQQGRPVALIFSMASRDPMGSERAAHEALADCRLDGEWFDVEANAAIDVAMKAARAPIPSQARSAGEAAIASLRRLQERGGGRFPTLTLDPEEMALWDRLVARYGGSGRGEAKRTLMAALNALDRPGVVTKAEVAAWVRQQEG